MNPIHGKNGNCDPVACDMYAAAKGGIAFVQSIVQTAGVAKIAKTASACVANMNARRERAARTSSWMKMKLTPINCSTSTARNARQRPASTYGSSASWLPGRCSA